MSQYLVGLAARSIQRYVFASNRLVDIIGASALVEELFDAEKLRHDFGPLNTEVLTSQGGSATLLVTGDTPPTDGVACFSRRRLITAPGVEADVQILTHQTGSLAEELLLLGAKLTEASAAPTTSVPHPAGAGFASCRATGGAASGIDPRTHTPLSRQAAAARQRGLAEADRRGTPLPTPLHNWSAIEPTELDHLGRTSGQRSLIGVVHIDGNGIGAKIERWLQGAKDLADAEFIAQLVGWSTDLSLCTDAAWEEVRQLTEAAIHEKFDGGSLQLRGEVEDLNFGLVEQAGGAGRKSTFLPIRKILQGGDDLTFVCEGRIALSLAVAATTAFGEHVAGTLGPVSACAGVALVHSHSPFVRAYDLANQLCENAKQAFSGEAALDWQLGLLEPGQSLAEARKPLLPGLTCRPYRLQSDAPHRSWAALDELLLGTDPGGDSLRSPQWSAVGAKVRTFPALARRGPDVLASELRAWRIVDNRLSLPPPYQTNGFATSDGKTSTPLLDAVELLSRHQQLRPFAASAQDTDRQDGEQLPFGERFQAGRP